MSMLFITLGDGLTDDRKQIAMAFLKIAIIQVQIRCSVASGIIMPAKITMPDDVMKLDTKEWRDQNCQMMEMESKA
jgi:hypothetical protein